MQHKQQTAQAWFTQLRDHLCAAFMSIEDDLQGSLLAPGRFERRKWERPGGGGGEMSLMRGRVFEKIGVNISTVHGEFEPKFRAEIPGASEDPRFWASGISLVAHPRSPLVPAAHFNTRMIVVGDSVTWFGGGGDLTPMYEIAQDTADFHAAFQKACDSYDKSFYPAFKSWCDEYFYLPHRQMTRGVGGIFYDYLGLGDNLPAPRAGRTQRGIELAAATALDWNGRLAFTQDVGKAFLHIYPELVRRHLQESWTKEQRDWQLQKRGYYAEFNLLYDRGTRFGLMTGGNTEAILMSLPPEATWP